MPETELGNAQLEAVAHVPEVAGVELALPPPPPPHAVSPIERMAIKPISFKDFIFMEVFSRWIINYKI